MRLTPQPQGEEMTEEELQEWQERLRAAVAETLRKRAARAAYRAERATARAYGLQARHHAKLNRPKDKP